jgi:hypothetical protein
MQRDRVLKSSNGVVPSEHALLDGKNIVSRAYTVKSGRSPAVSNFSTLGEADTYFDTEVIQVLNPPKEPH